MLPPENPERFDQSLREILDADPDADDRVDRITRRALASPAEPAFRFRPAAAATLAAAALLLLLVLLPGKPPRPRETASLSITNIGGVIAVQDPAGRASIIQVSETEAPSGGQIFISMGEPQ